MRAPIIGLVCALVALVALVLRPDLPLLDVTVFMVKVFMGRLPGQRCRRQSRCGRGHEQDSDSLVMRLPRQSVADDASLAEPSKPAMQIGQTDDA